MNIVNHIALIAGYGAMAVGALLVIAAALLGRYLLLRSQWVKVRNGVDLIEAATEWKRNHPEKLTANRKRNGVEDD